jgi:DNA-directed RNA polymerase alpha subunit/DNA-directed RNA polymerase subunit L
MNPSISQVSEDGDLLGFTLSGINLCFANALRRTILSDIPCVVIHTETYETNQCNITKNTGRLHNEILKHRLSCIPIHTSDLVDFPNKYVLELNVKNDTENIMYVTTEHFRIKNKENGNYLTKDETIKIFPPNIMTSSFIDFARLRPAISDSIPGEELSLTANFSLSTAKTNSMYNVVSKCSYGNTPDQTKIMEAWETQESKLKSEGSSQTDIEFQKKNFYLLDAQRQFIPDSFDFVLQTIGVYENKDLVKKGCAVLQNKFIDMIQAIDSDIMPIFNSETTMDYCFDVILENEDYTIGKVLEYIIYEKHYQGDKTLSFCGFKKFHPHNADSTLRIAFEKSSDKNSVKFYLREAAIDAQDLFRRIYEMFK